MADKTEMGNLGMYTEFSSGRASDASVRSSKLSDGYEMESYTEFSSDRASDASVIKHGGVPDGWEKYSVAKDFDDSATPSDNPVKFGAGGNIIEKGAQLATSEDVPPAAPTGATTLKL